MHGVKEELVRDPSSSALINKDVEKLKRYKMDREASKWRERVDQELARLRTEVAELKQKLENRDDKSGS